MLRELVERAQRVFDALHRAERIFRIEVCRVEALSFDEEFRHRLAIERKARKPLSPARNCKASEGGAQLKGEIVPVLGKNNIRLFKYLKY